MGAGCREAPGGFQEALGRPLGGARDATGRLPGGLGEARGRLQGGSREAPGRLPGGSGEPLRATPTLQRSPRGALGPPGTPQDPPKNPLKSPDWRVMSEPARDHNAPKRVSVAALVCRGVFSKMCTAPRREAHFDGSAWLNRPKICFPQAFDKHGKL